jgi:ribosome modulation factor
MYLSPLLALISPSTSQITNREYHQCHPLPIRAVSNTICIERCPPSLFVPLALVLDPASPLVLPSGVSTIVIGAYTSESDRDTIGEYHQTNLHDTIECRAAKQAGVVKQSKQEVKAAQAKKRNEWLGGVCGTCLCLGSIV